MSSFCWQKKKPFTFDENIIAALLLSLLTRESSVFRFAIYLSSVISVFVCWSIETTTARFDSLKTAKYTNQVTLSNDHINYLFQA